MIFPLRKKNCFFILSALSPFLGAISIRYKTIPVNLVLRDQSERDQSEREREDAMETLDAPLALGEEGLSSDEDKENNGISIEENFDFTKYAETMYGEDHINEELLSFTSPHSSSSIVGDRTSSSEGVPNRDSLNSLQDICNLPTLSSGSSLRSLRSSEFAGGLGGSGILPTRQILKEISKELILELITNSN